MKVDARRLLRIWAAAVALSAPAYGNYHYVHYLPGAPNTPVFERFDLSALPNKTVTFMVSDNGPATLGVNDDFGSVLSQIKQATLVWNSVASSDLRVAFGGLGAANQTANTPSGDVVFVDLPPGLLGMGTPTLAANPTAVNGPNGPFFPVVRGTVMLTNNTSIAPGPSYLESFFTTAVHEMGHALGLQHTFTASAMSQGVVRNTSRTRPIDVDDIAGLSILYGNASYAATVGSISGRVTSNGQGVALASVVAITEAGPAISSLTNPDGSYRIDGLPPNQYWVYVHPLPPDADIKGPFDPSLQTIPASGPTETLFYPGTRDPNQFGVVPVTAGGAASGINFSVQPRAAVPVYDLITHSYSGQASATPAFVDSRLSLNSISAQALYPLPTPLPQSVTVPGYSNASFQLYGSPVALGLYLTSPLAPGTGPRHILFNYANDMYVMPYGLVLVLRGAPAISSVTPNGDGTVTVAGVNFGTDSLVYFDGLPAAAASVFTGDATNGSITVTPPIGFGGQIASIIVYNNDGQNSTLYQSQGPPTYAYPAAPAPQITVTPAALPVGTTAMVDITAANMQFVDGQVTVGLGTTDIWVRRVWVVSPSHLIADVSVAAGGALGTSDISVISGFQTVYQPTAFQIQPVNPAAPWIAGTFNTDAYQKDFYPGAVASLYGSNLAILSRTPQVTLNNQPAQVLYSSANQVNFVVPAGIPAGPAILRVFNGSASAFPVAVQIDNPPPIIEGAINIQGQPVTASQPVSSGDTLFVLLSGVDPSAVANKSLFSVTISGVSMPVMQVNPGPGGTVQVAFQVTQSFGGSAVPVVISVSGSASDPITITVQ